MKKKSILITIFVILMSFTSNVFAECTLEYTTCGSGANQVTGIPVFVPRLISFFVMLLQIIIPIVLIITGMIEMTKSVSSGNPDNIAKGRLKLIKKFVAALFAFLVITFTTNIIRLIADNSEKSTFIDCMSCYLNNKCGENYCGYVDASSSLESCTLYSYSNCKGNYDKYGVKCVQMPPNQYSTVPTCGYGEGGNPNQKPDTTPTYPLEGTSNCYKYQESKFCTGYSDQNNIACSWVNNKCIIKCDNQSKEQCKSKELKSYCKWKDNKCQSK